MACVTQWSNQSDDSQSARHQSVEHSAVKRTAAGDVILAVSTSAIARCQLRLSPSSYSAATDENEVLTDVVVFRRDDVFKQNTPLPGARMQQGVHEKLSPGGAQSNAHRWTRQYSSSLTVASMIQSDTGIDAS
jgi:hypothetical protein